MTLMRWRPRREWDPFAELSELQGGINRLFSTSLAPWFGGSAEGWLSNGWPVMDVSQDDANVMVTAELPGLKDNEVEVSITGDTLTLKGEKKQESETKDKNYHRIERSYGRFERVVELPTEVDAAKTTAEMKNGVLTITLPKTEAHKAKQIKVSVK